MGVKNWLASALVAGSLMLAACGAVATAPSIAHTTVPSLGTKAASFDVVDIDQAAHRLYAADRTDGGVDVFDVSSPSARYLKTIPITDANGIAVAPDLGQVFVGAADGVSVIDVKAGSSTADTVIKQIPTGANSVDLIDYAPSVHKLFASNGTHGTVSVIDTTKDTVAAVFKVGYALEQPRFNPADGTLYVPSPDAGALFQLDATTGKIKNRISISGCGAGLAIDPKLDKALIACGAYVTLVDLHNPSTINNLLDVSGGDVVTFDATVDRFFVAAPGSKPATIGVFGGDPIAYIASVDTGAGSNSAVYDETNHLVYAPDTRAGMAGLDSFSMPTGGLSLNASWADIAIFGILLGAVAVFMFLVGRHADPINRQEPIPRRRRVKPQA